MLVVVVWLVGVTDASASTLHHPNVLGEPVDVRLSWRGDFPTVPEDGTMQSPASFPFFAAVEEGEDFQDEEEAPVQDLQDLDPHFGPPTPISKNFLRTRGAYPKKFLILVHHP